MSDDFWGRLDRVRRAARKGAKSVTWSPPLVDFAVERAVERFEDAEARRKRIERLGGWAYRVGRNAALAAIRASGGTKPTALAEFDQPAGAGDEGSLPSATRQQLKRWLRMHRTRITAEQLLVVELLAVGFSYHSAAKRLGKDRSNLKRTFMRALRRLMGG